jgi:rubredoxin
MKRTKVLKLKKKCRVCGHIFYCTNHKDDPYLCHYFEPTDTACLCPKCMVERAPFDLIEETLKKCFNITRDSPEYNVYLMMNKLSRKDY